MKVHEYQAKEIMSKYGIPIPNGGVASTPDEASRIADELGGKAVVKAQVHAGGRGKAGGVKLVDSASDAKKAAESLIGTQMVTHQTGPSGVPINKVLVEEQAGVSQELYLAILIDASVKEAVVIASSAGGMDIEEVAEKSPEKILRVPIDPALGIQPFQGRKIAYALGLEADLVRPLSDLVSRLYKLYIDMDSTLVEINPLVITNEKKIVALDAKMSFEDDALFRHKDLEPLRDVEQEDPFEVEAQQYDLSYVHLDGDVGCMVNGAGLAMATMDIVKKIGAEPANFLDVGGGASEDKIAQAFKLMMSDPAVKKVLVNIFGGILRCDIAANGIVMACKDLDINPTMVVRMKGTNVNEGRKILEDSKLNAIFVESLSEAAAKLTELK